MRRQFIQTSTREQVRGRAGVAALFLVIGAAAGYGAAYRQFASNAGPPPPPTPWSATQELGPAAFAPDIEDAVIAVQLFDAEGEALTRRSGMLVSPERLLVLPAAALDGVGGGQLNADGGVWALGDVVAVAAEAGLVALRTGLDTIPGLEPSPERGNLYVGREVAIIAGGRAVPALVDSSAQRQSDGNYLYEISTDARLNDPFAPLLVPGTPQLVGVVVGAGATPGRYLALDASAVAELMASQSRTLPMTIAQFSADYFEETAEGRLARLRGAAGRADWTTVLRLGPGLIDLGWQYRDVVGPELESAYAAQVAALSPDSPRAGLALLEQAAALLGWTGERHLMAARLSAAEGSLQDALAHLQFAGQLDPALEGDSRALTRRLLMQALDSDALPLPSMITLLEDAALRDSGFADYRAGLGRLLFEEGRYIEAVSSLSEAIALEPALASELEPLMATARKRSSTPEFAVVPVLSSGSILYVHGWIGGLERRLRFILDTGASYTAISAATAQALGLAPSLSSPRVELSTANGYLIAALATVPSITVERARVDEVQVVVLDSLGDYDGLLGLSFLDHFNIELDRNQGEMTLVRR